ncbi:hypothetical protein AMTR_s00069p00076340 [Amborella trichopoda]|uniref:SET domain-containing protein n=1 Tax=Amborella trichopoda TaxID=13333 RepID=U5D9Z1_AMBTC|nr:hypothetical protein AMTR_s00069p00076340 [Amborella trichopoda]
MGSEARHVSPKTTSQVDVDEVAEVTVMKTVYSRVKKNSVAKVISERRCSSRVKRKPENENDMVYRFDRKYERRGTSKKAKDRHGRASDNPLTGLGSELVENVKEEEEPPNTAMELTETMINVVENCDAQSHNQAGMSASALVKDTLRVFDAHFLRFVQLYGEMLKGRGIWLGSNAMGFDTFPLVHFTRAQPPKSISELRGLVCEDISGRQENFQIPATNEVDPPLAPSGFTYYKSIKVGRGITLPPNAEGCQCSGDCVDSRRCACARLNGSEFPYVSKNGGRLVQAKDVIYECGPNCGCGPDCVNRTSQRGLRYRLEVFRTPKKGWAVRSWDTIPSGAPVCEYTGLLMRTNEADNDTENNFIFDIDCLQTIKGIDGRQRRFGDVSIHNPANFEKIEDKKLEGSVEFCIDAGSCGSVARFINHSCEPNLFVQCVLSSHHDMKLARVMLFASDNIPPLQELSYDYGYALDSVVGIDGKIKEMPCYCGSSGCRKRLY